VLGEAQVGLQEYLEPPVRRVDLLDRHRRGHAQDQQRAGRRDRLGRRQFAVGMREPVVWRRCDVHGHAELATEQCGRQVRDGVPAQYPRPQREPGEGGLVVANCHLVIRATG
jgi:hypothetical protein